ncbi:glucose-6-phosphate isomerase family protein [Pseudocitrobacter sp. 73]|uniref:glucose-6-phosphate isomerase family protein n=1 Tax=Pseudocitrobacter sp. 73 TaxID=2605731 RepID=UPI0011EC64CB|nr:glucose-6-phosphate isomerase family protein [Pseudocitrobacter sp. 73]KAA1049597.1 glucose-6-phosphate isomerase [Pseudocitrobacter sp. 73]
MDSTIIQPPHLAWCSGALSGAPLLTKSTTLQDLPGVFADHTCWQSLAGSKPVYHVEMFATPDRPGELYTGVTHLMPGKVGEEFFMTRGHFHARREQGEVYIGLRGEGLLLLQDEQNSTRLERVYPGSVHTIPGFTAHRLINTGNEILSALAVWPCSAGHDYSALKNGFALRVVDDAGSVRVMEVNHD